MPEVTSKHHFLIKQFIVSAFDDYLAGRFLMNNNYSWQAVLMSCSAVERYLKAAALVVNGDYQKFHIDKLSKLKQMFRGAPEAAILNSFDDTFFGILSRAYEFRYIDKFRVPKSFGFFINQFLAELDYTIYTFDNLFVVQETESLWKSPFKRAVENKAPDLFQNNYLLNNQDKIAFMQTETEAFGIHYDPNKMMVVHMGLAKKLPVKYEGTMTLIEGAFE